MNKITCVGHVFVNSYFRDTTDMNMRFNDLVIALHIVCTHIAGHRIWLWMETNNRPCPVFNFIRGQLNVDKEF